MRKSRKEYDTAYKAVYRSNPENRERRNAQARKYRLAHFGITPEEYDTILEYQGGVCALCERPPTGRNLDVDHEHQPKEKSRSPESRRIRIRGLLCHRCNRALGLLGNDPQKLLMVVENLSRYISEYYAKRLVDTSGLDEARRLMGNTVAYLERFEKRLAK